MVIARPICYKLLAMNQDVDDGKQDPRLLSTSSPLASPSSTKVTISTEEKKRERRCSASSQQHQQLEKSLGSNYDPSSFDVICAKGKEAREHTGNRRFRLLVDMNLDRYRAANSKIAKSSIVTDIVDAIRISSPGGGFIKMSEGTWYQVSEHHAREKVGQSFRDRLHTDYKSSSKAKIRKRKMNEEADYYGRFSASSAMAKAAAVAATAKTSSENSLGSSSSGGDEERARKQFDPRRQNPWKHLHGILAASSDEIISNTLLDRNVDRALSPNGGWPRAPTFIDSSSPAAPWANRWINLPNPLQLSMSSAILGQRQSNLALPQVGDLARERLSSHRYRIPRPEDFSQQLHNLAGDHHMASLLALKKASTVDHRDDPRFRSIRSPYQDSRRSRSEGSVNGSHHDPSLRFGQGSHLPAHLLRGGVDEQHRSAFLGANGAWRQSAGGQQQDGQMHPDAYHSGLVRRHSLGSTACDEDATGSLEVRKEASEDLLSFSRSHSSSFSREFAEDQESHISREG